MNATLVMIQAWFLYFTTLWWVKGLGMIAAFWILMQLLPNSWASGRLFNRKFAWISSSLAAIIVFITFVLPWIAWQLIVGIVVTIVLLGLAAWTKKNWQEEKTS